MMEIMNVDTKESAQNSDSQEHSRNSLQSVAGGASDRVNQQRRVGKTIDPELHSGTSKYREFSQKLQSSEKRQMRKHQEKLCIKCLIKMRTWETAKVENILKTRGKSKPEWT